MSAGHRTERVASLIREELMKLLLHDVSDPLLAAVSITDVEVTADLKQARVFYIEGLGKQWTDKEKRLVRMGFERAASFLRRRVGDSLEMRYTPEFSFEYDSHPDAVNRVMALMDSPTSEDRV